MDNENRIHKLENIVSNMDRHINALQEMHVNNALETDKKFNEMNSKINDTKQSLDMLVERYGQLNKTYSDFELVELKNKYSWPNLSKLTGIPD